ncbi:MAG: ABC transporter substrate-binding protein [Brevinematia bacterium]
MKRLLSIFTIGVIALFSCAKPVVIGFVDNVSGFTGKRGNNFRMAAQIAIDEKNKAGGIKGHKLALKVFDTKGDQKASLEAMDKLIQQKAVAVIGGPELAEKAQSSKTILMIVNSRYKVEVSPADFIFRNTLSYELEAIVLAKYVYNVIGIKKIAILVVTNAYGTQVSESFKKTFIEEGGSVVIEKYIHHIEDPYSDDSDFKDELKEIKGKAEAIFIPNGPVENQRILISADELGMKVKFISSSSYHDPDVFSPEVGELANGVYFSSIPEDLTEIPPARESFEKAFEAKFKLTPTYEAINAYDATKLIIAAIEKTYDEATSEEKASFKLDPEKIKQNLLGIKDFDGVMSKLSVLENGEVNREVGIYKSELMGFVQQGVYLLQDGKIVQVR